MPLSAQDLEKLRLGVQNRCKPKLRGIEFEFRPLTIAEVVEATTEASAAYERALPAQRHSINESHIIAISILSRASYLAKGVPGVTKDTLEMLTPDELGFLFREYNTMTEQCNPALETIPDEQLHLLAEELKKNPSLRTELSSLQLLNLVRYLATRPN
jgi:hypothetical protein